MTGAVWNARANNPYYRITELVLPPSTSAGLQSSEFTMTLLPHRAGRLLVKRQAQERDTQIHANQVIEFEGGTEFEIVNTGDLELRFTIMEYK